MAIAALAGLEQRLVSGVVISPTDVDLPAPLRFVLGQHPEPGEGSLAAGRAALATAGSCDEDDLLLLLVSGGASALMAAPADGLTLDDKRAATAQLLRGGADIRALNTVRKHLSALKGGRLAAASRARCLTLAMSDVVGDDPSVIGSGPTVADGSSYAEALVVLEMHGGVAAFPPQVVAHLIRGVAGQIPETPKKTDPRLARSTYQIIGSRVAAMQGAAAAASARGFAVTVLDAAVVGEARAAAEAHLRHVLEVASQRRRPCCVVSSGETTVTVRGAGRGGRNQEFALALVERLDGQPRPMVVASVGTDGVDGPTDAAGAIADASTLARGRAAGLDAARFLDANDSHTYFATLGDLIQTGPTGTNVGDLQVFLLA